MRVLDVYPKDTVVLMEISLTNLEQLLDFLDHCEMKYDGEKEPSMKEAEEYVNEIFFKQLYDLMLDVKPGFKAKKVDST